MDDPHICIDVLDIKIIDMTRLRNMVFVYSPNSRAYCSCELFYARIFITYVIKVWCDKIINL